MTRVKTVMTTVLGWLAAFLLIVMAFLVLFQVFTRYVLDDPASFTEELVRYFLIWTGFIGGAYAFVTRQHMALVFVRDRFGEGPRRWLMAFADALVLVFALVVIVIGGTQLAMGPGVTRRRCSGCPAASSTRWRPSRGCSSCWPRSSTSGRT